MTQTIEQLQTMKGDEMDNDRDPIWDALKSHSKEKFDSDRSAFLAKANADDDEGWTKHTDYHWSRMVNGKRLDYWPSRKKFMLAGWKGARRGDVMKIVKGELDGPEAEICGRV